MEIFELHYFLAVARHENIHRASEELNVSPGSLSKAVARLEGELGVKLFGRQGRHIGLTDQGRLLQRRASQIVQLEESARIELAGQEGSVHAIVAGPEILLSRFGLELDQSLRRKFQRATVEFHSADDKSALEEVVQGMAHLAIVTSDVPTEFDSKALENTSFQTYVAAKHPLFSQAKSGKTVSIDEVLKHGFVSPDNPLLGAVGIKQSLDGWRDDKFPRRMTYLASSLKILEAVVCEGLAIAYLPDYFAASLPLKALKISGCPYTCTQKIKLVTRDRRETGWINQIF